MNTAVTQDPIQRALDMAKSSGSWLAHQGDRAIHQGIPSVVNSAKGLYHLVADDSAYPQRQAIRDAAGNLAMSTAHNVANYFGHHFNGETPNGEAQANQPYNDASTALGNYVVDPYTTVNSQGHHTFSPQKTWKTWSDTPERPLMDASMLMTGGDTALGLAGDAAKGVSGIADAGGLAGISSGASNVANGLHAGSKMARTASEALNPMAWPIRGTQAVVKGAYNAASPFLGDVAHAFSPEAMLGSMSGVGEYNVRNSGNAGYQSMFPPKPGQSPAGEVWNSIRKNPDAQTLAGIPADVSNAIKMAKQQRINDLISAKSGMSGTVDPNDLHQGLDSIVANVTKGGVTGLTDGQRAALSKSRSMIDNLPSNDLNTVDGLRQSFGVNMANAPTDDARDIYSKMYGHTRQVLGDAIPGYTDAMNDYNGTEDIIKNLQSVSGGPRSAPAARLARVLSKSKTASGSSIIDDLSQYAPDLKTKLAAYSGVPVISESARGAYTLPGMVTAAGGVLGSVAHDPMGYALGLPMGAAVGAASSPRLVTSAAYGLGKLSGAVDRVIPQAVRDATGTAANLGMAAGRRLIPSTPALAQAAYRGEPNMVNPPMTEDEAFPASIYKEDAAALPPEVGAVDAPENGSPSEKGKVLRESDVQWDTPAPSDQGTSESQQAYARGGSVKKKHEHEDLVMRLMNLATAAKKATNKTTKPLLNVPDQAIAKALHIAQRAV